MTRRLIGVVAVLGGLVAPAPAAAETFNVNTTADNATCAATCSLRGALIAAAGNGSAVRDTINLPAGTYNLVQAQGGQLIVPENVRLSGAGANRTFIEGDGKSFRTMVIRSDLLVEIANVTIGGGAALGGNADDGGNLSLDSFASLRLDHVRVTRGVALRGGGISMRGGGTVEIRHSLIDNNEAVPTASGPPAEGGGILVTSSDPSQQLIVTDSTIAFNKAQTGSGLMVMSHDAHDVRLARVTVADNASSLSRGGGIFIADGAGAVQVRASILARNIGNVSVGRLPASGPTNCALTQPVDAGANVESVTDCGFDVQNSTAGLAASLVGDGGQTPVLPIPADSAARDLGGACTGSDQRDVVRPQGQLCDAGAYEYVPPPPPPPEAPADPPVLPMTPGATQPPPVPMPVANRTVVVRTLKGRVRIRLRGSRDFVDLDAAQGIPTGSEVDTRKGVVELTSVPRAGAPPETAKFYDGLFIVTQSRGITNLRLTELMQPCSSRARSSQRRPKKRKLWGDGRGSFRTTGRYSAATVRGTKWLVQDSCAGTLTRVTQGSVSVRDKVEQRTIIVRAGRRYLARPRR